MGGGGSGFLSIRFRNKSSLVALIPPDLHASWRRGPLMVPVDGLQSSCRGWFRGRRGGWFEWTGESHLSQRTHCDCRRRIVVGARHEQKRSAQGNSPGRLWSAGTLGCPWGLLGTFGDFCRGGWGFLAAVDATTEGTREFRAFTPSGRLPGGPLDEKSTSNPSGHRRFPFPLFLFQLHFSLSFSLLPLQGCKLQAPPTAATPSCRTRQPLHPNTIQYCLFKHPIASIKACVSGRPSMSRSFWKLDRALCFGNRTKYRDRDSHVAITAARRREVACWPHRCPSERFQIR